MNDAQSAKLLPAALAPQEAEERPFAAIGLVLMSLVVFSGLDAISKILVADYSPVLITWGRYGANLMLLLPFMLRAGARPFATAGIGLQIGRGFAMGGSSVLFIAGLAQMAMPDATAVAFAAPLMVTALSIPFLGERVGIRRWSAVAVGFVGVMVIVQPGSSSFHLASLFPLASAACWAAGLIITRRIKTRDATLTTLLYTTLVAFLIMTAFLPWVWQPLPLRALGLILVMGVLSSAGQYFLLLGYQRGPASLLAPFSYMQIITSTFWSAVLFGTWPGAATLIGAPIVVASGLYVFHRERVRRGEPR
ncbi:MAG TPA: DMT family transporter [Stellaceae bacterium]|jgi:drug/metabolite transporter (DMT)-like permease|nr:DMT family transporter [Stellaceae bacterium]